LSVLFRGLSFSSRYSLRKVSRELIADIEKAGIEKSEFFQISIEAMQGIADEIGM